MPSEFAADQSPVRDLRTREGRALALLDAVWCAECTLPPPARFLVAYIVTAAHEREAMTVERAARSLTCTPRTARKYMALLAAACGEDPDGIVRDVLGRRRPVTDWARALEKHGGRRGS